MDCFGTYFTHAQTCNVTVKRKSAVSWRQFQARRDVFAWETWILASIMLAYILQIMLDAWQREVHSKKHPPSRKGTLKENVGALERWFSCSRVWLHIPCDFFRWIVVGKALPTRPWNKPSLPSRLNAEEEVRLEFGGDVSGSLMNGRYGLLPTQWSHKMVQEYMSICQNPQKFKNRRDISNVGWSQELIDVSTAAQWHGAPGD